MQENQILKLIHDSDIQFKDGDKIIFVNIIGSLYHNLKTEHHYYSITSFGCVLWIIVEEPSYISGPTCVKEIKMMRSATNKIESADIIIELLKKVNVQNRFHKGCNIEKFNNKAKEFFVFLKNIIDKVDDNDWEILTYDEDIIKNEKILDEIRKERIAFEKYKNDTLQMIDSQRKKLKEDLISFRKERDGFEQYIDNVLVPFN